MRVSTPFFNSSSMSGIATHSEKLYDIQQKLSSGQRVMTPGDDPVASSRIYRAQKSMDNIDQLAKNGDYARDKLTLEDRALSDVGSVLQRVRELAVQGMNDTYSAEDRKSMATEIRGMLENLVSLSNTQDSNGEYIFAGDDSDTAPFTMSKDASGNPSAITANIANTVGARFVQIGIDNDNQVDIANPDVGDASRVRVSDNGNRVFSVTPNPLVSGINGAVDSTNIMDSIRTLADMFDTQGAALPSDANEYLTELDSSIKNVGQIQTEVGTRVNRIDMQYEMNQDFKQGLTENMSSIRDMDMVTGISDYQKILSGLQMSQLTYSKVSELSLFNYLR